ncbi:MAG: hypothetical protein ABEK17_03500 [Candidatus Aenigmatarchaeota archaeon]
MNKFIFTIVLFSFLVLPLVSADLGVNIETQKYCSPPPAEFKVQITNNQDVEDTFATIITDKYRSWATIPQPYVTLNPDESTKVSIKVDAPEDVVSGEYYLPVLSYSTTNTSVRANRTLCLSVLRKYDAKLVSSNITDSIKPGGNAILTVQVENIGTKDFEDMSINAKLRKNGKLVEEKDMNFDLASGIRAKKEIKFEIGQFQNPGEYTVTADLEGAGKFFGTTTKKFNVEGAEEIDKKKYSKKTWLSEKYTVEVINNGNTPYVGNIEVSISKPWDMLLSSEGEPVIQDTGNQMVYSWYVSMEPNSTKEIEYQINYWPLYLVAIIILVILLKLFLMWRSPHIKKKVLEKGGAEEKEAEFTITLEVENKSWKTLKDVVVRDVVPGVAEVVEDFKSIKPNLNEKESGTELVWRLADFESGDERLLTYKIKMVVGTSDYFNLPKASLNAKSQEGTKYRKHSNKVKVEATKEK